jgi:hypothetical protein
MFWKTSILIAGLWATSLSAQEAPSTRPGALPRPERVKAVLHGVLKPPAQPEEATACSIPLREVTVAKENDPMPKLPAPVTPDNSENVDHMPMVRLPAPPCQEEKR